MAPASKKAWNQKKASGSDLLGLFGEEAIADLDDTVGGDEGARTVRDRHDGAARSCRRNRGEDLRLTGKINLTGRFIEQKYGPISEDCPGQGKALGLTTGKPEPLFAELSVEGLGHVADLISQGNSFEGLPHLSLTRLRRAQTQVICDRAGE